MVWSLGGAAVFASLRRWPETVAAVAVVGLATATQLPLFVPDREAGEGPDLIVMQANIMLGEADPDALVAEAERLGVDLLTVEELTASAADRLGRAGLDEVLPFRYLAAGTGASGTGIWSRYPLTDPTGYDGFVMNQVSVTAQVPDVGPVAVYAFHPVPPVFGTATWSAELTALGAILDEAPAGIPVVVGGDFNATYDHSPFRRLLSGRFRDAVTQAGSGYLATYPTDRRFPPVVGIDHVLVADAHAVDVATVDLPGSDHRAVVATVRIG